MQDRISQAVAALQAAKTRNLRYHDATQELLSLGFTQTEVEQASSRYTYAKTTGDINQTSKLNQIFARAVVHEHAVESACKQAEQDRLVSLINPRGRNGMGITQHIRTHNDLKAYQDIQNNPALSEEALKDFQPNEDLTQKQERILAPSDQSVSDIRAIQLEEKAQQTESQSINTNKQVRTIYPDATMGIGATPTSIPAPVVPSTERSPVDAQIKRKALLVRIVAGIIILICVINALSWLHQSHASPINWINIVEIVLTLCLAIRMCGLSESARSIYVLLSALVLTISCISILAVVIAHYKDHTSVTVSSTSSNESAVLKHEQISAENNPRYTTKQKLVLQKLYQQQINQIDPAISIRLIQYVSEVLLIITSFGPLIFFTRPSIKSIFS